MSASGQQLLMNEHDTLPDNGVADDDDGINVSRCDMNVSKVGAYSQTSEDDDDINDTDCLIHSCNRISNPVAFLSVIIPLFVLFIAAPVYLGACISTIEKQFQLSSSQSGLIATVNEIVSLTIIIFVTYYGSKTHRPRLMGVSGIICATGLFLLAVPHFIANSVEYSSNDNDTDESTKHNNELCSLGDVTEDRCASGGSTVEQPLSVFWLVIGQILVGFEAPILPLAITYLDDSTVDSTTSSIYIAGIYITMGVGPFVGFFMSFQCLSLYVDFDRVHGENIPTDPTDPRWIGAWWLGFVLVSVLVLVLSVPLFFFPRNLKKYECACCGGSSKNKDAEEEFNIADVYKTDFFKDKQNGILASLKGFVVAMKRILVNPTLMFLTIAVSCDFAIIAGFMFFVAKYIENQFAVTAAVAAIIIGGIQLPGTVFSNILSSFCIKKFDLNQFGLGKMMVVFSFFSFIFAIPLLFMGCSNQAIVGVTTHYDTSFSQGSLPHLNTTCNSNCACPDDVYTPVCGSDGITYISACHAGCTNVWRDGMGNLDKLGLSTNDTIYVGCSCITNGKEWETADGLIKGGISTEGSCDWTCDKLLAFSLLVAIISVFAAMKPNPGTMLMLRCVESSDRALAIAFGGVAMRVLGFFPAPIYFGSMISKTCLIRQDSCSHEGACLVYDLERYRYSFVGLFLGLKLLATILAMCTYYSINPDRFKENKESKTKTMPMEPL
ncbi:solute carrier organic anion transporter family member 2A1-like isoform X4 [Anneissia japonica]|uniref:solute carrier organic anion transporter family member 2A1-like isoform X2 n=1 Tax=Anneissia japonica TaxID=1529436 RepID=UPI001425A192|nr:solute carrier organic anion transporter family member 2A1-like isoform X2 [Anneissia japonica]XP_033121681.1 solute carrier organic anion transporter family member 2A1-like isoform X4 [Anneissia japonica]